MFGEKAVEVLKELKQNQWVPPYNHEGMEKVVQEIDQIYHELVKNLNDARLRPTEPAIATNLITYHFSFLRNKRCILAYIYERLQRIKRLRWQCGNNLPAHLEQNLNSTEREFFERYNTLLTDYNVDLGLDLTSDLQPPKDVYLEVKIIKTDSDKDGMVLESGTLKLHKNHIYYLKRSDAETLIQQGYAQQINNIHQVLS